MSLRVLLADESDTIKKVFQLALQDLNAEVKSVHSGLDVMDVARTFKPDIVFADILLQKKNGYEICLQIKQSPDMSSIPVVLMWSSFMELDQEQFRKSQATDQLEKPFDADHLREIVKKHTTAVDDNPMAAFLSFPKSIAADAPPGAKTRDRIPMPGLDLSFGTPTDAPSASESIPLSEANDDEDTSEFNLGSILGEVGSPTTLETDALTRTSAGAFAASPKSLFDDLAKDAAPSTHQEPWQEKDLSPFKIGDDKSDDLDKFEALNLSSPETNTATVAPVLPKELSLSGTKDTFAPINMVAESSPAIDRFSLNKSATLPPSKEQTNTATRPAIKTSTISGMSGSEIEGIVRAHTEEVIKNQLKDSLLPVIEKIVREELNRIMEEELRLQQDADIDT